MFNNLCSVTTVGLAVAALVWIGKNLGFFPTGKLLKAVLGVIGAGSVTFVDLAIVLGCLLGVFLAFFPLILEGPGSNTCASPSLSNI